MKNFFKTCLGILSVVFGLEGFLLPNHFIDGGITGISMLASTAINLPLPILIFLINLPFLIIGFRQLNKKFIFKSFLAILGLALALFIFTMPIITHDKLIAAVFGGFFLGVGIGLSIRAGAALDGTEILAIWASKKTGLTIGNIILFFNAFIFLVGAFYLGTEKALYSVLTYYSASKTLDFILNGLEEYTGITIISPLNETIRQNIKENTSWGVTVYKGKGGFSEQEQEILFCVITRLEVPKLKSIVEEIDSNAFLITHSLNEASGGMVKRKLSIEI